MIFLHSNYQTQLSSAELASYELVRKLFFSWAMPFFYATMCFFTFKSLFKDFHWTKVAQRALYLVGYLIFFILGIESLRLAKALIFGSLYAPFALDTSSSTIFRDLFTLISTSNSSAGYFFFDSLIALGLGVFLTHMLKLTSQISLIHHYKRYSYPLLSLVLVSIMFSLGSTITFNKIKFFIAMIMASAFALVSLRQKPVTIRLPSYLMLLPLLIPWFLLAYQSSPTEPRIYIFRLILLNAFVLGAYFVTVSTSNQFLVRLSSWGQKYSLGMYLTHIFVLAVLDNVIPRLPVISSLNHLTIFWIISGVGLLSTLALVVSLGKIYPRLIRLS